MQEIVERQFEDLPLGTIFAPREEYSLVTSRWVKTSLNSALPLTVMGHETLVESSLERIGRIAEGVNRDQEDSFTGGMYHTKHEKHERYMYRSDHKEHCATVSANTLAKLVKLIIAGDESLETLCLLTGLDQAKLSKELEIIRTHYDV